MTGKYYSPARFAVLFLFLIVLLLLRRPDMLTNPQLYAEDGSVFLRDQLIFPWTAVLFPYNGQFHTLPRLIALFESFFPLTAVPLLCSLVSIVINAFCLSIFFLPWNRWLIESDLLRAAVCVVMATTLDGSEMIGFSGPLMWFLYLAAILLLFRPESDAPETVRERVIIMAAVLLIGLSVAPMVMMIPLAIWLVVKRRGFQQGVAVAFLLAMAFQTFALVFTPRTDHPANLPGVLNLTVQVGTATVVSLEYAGVMTPVLGKANSLLISRLGAIGPPLFVVIGLTMMVTWLLTVSPWRDRLRIGVGLYIVFGTLASVLYTRNLVGYSLSLNGNAPFLPARYMVLAGGVLVYMVCLILQRLPLGDQRLQAVCLLLIFSAGIHSNFHQQPYADFSWKTAVPKIDGWRTVHAAGKPDPMAIPIVPTPWSIYLP